MAADPLANKIVPCEYPVAKLANPNAKNRKVLIPRSFFFGPTRYHTIVNPRDCQVLRNDPRNHRQGLQRLVPPPDLRLGGFAALR